jgi:2',3'-cyclic-nucleotide 2'-phosphodiesterase / 3'-nucleotidase / 5'-nucleotidase
VSVRGGILAAAVPQGEDDAGLGKVLFFDVDGTFVTEVTVGALPDMITYTPDGQLVLIANEGQPTQDYLVDPEGSVSIIDVSGGVASLTQDDVTTAGFTAFNAPAAIDSRIRIFGPNATVAQDLEPEYIAVSHDSTTAWVTLQENNALAIVDLKARQSRTWSHSVSRTIPLPVRASMRPPRRRRSASGRGRSGECTSPTPSRRFGCAVRPIS